MNNEFQCEFEDDPQRGAMYRFYADWVKPAPLRIGMKGGKPYEDEQVHAHMRLSALHAARFAAFIVHHLPEDLRNIVRAELAKCDAS